MLAGREERAKYVEPLGEFDDERAPKGPPAGSCVRGVVCNGRDIESIEGADSAGLGMKRL